MLNYSCQVDVKYANAQSAKDDFGRLKIVARQYDRNAFFDTDTTVVSVRFTNNEAGDSFGRMLKKERPDIVLACDLVNV